MPPAPHGPICRLLERELLEELIGARPRLVAGQLVELGEHHQVLAPGEVLVDGRVLARYTDHPAHLVGPRKCVDAGDGDPAAIWFQQGGEHPQRGGLACAVGAE